LQVGDHHAVLVGVGALVLLTSLCVPLGDGAVLVARDDVSGASRETGDCDLGNVVDDNAQRLLAGLLALGVLVDVVDDDCAELALALLGDTEQLAAVLVELDALDGRSKLPCLQQLSGLDLPESDGVVGATGCEQDGARVDIDGPESTLVALVDTKALTVVSPPSASVVILGNGEDEVALLAEPALVVSGRVLSVSLENPVGDAHLTWVRALSCGEGQLLWRVNDCLI
jgi:hypothetical protein